jgi:hypothetical protein
LHIITNGDKEKLKIPYEVFWGFNKNGIKSLYNLYYLFMSSRLFIILRWVLGLVFLLLALTSFNNLLAFIACILLAALLIPPVMNFIQRRIGKVFPRKYKVIAVVILLVILLIGIVSSNAATKSSKQKNNQAQSESLVPANNNQVPQAPLVPDNNTPANQSPTPTNKTSPTTPDPIPAPAPPPVYIEPTPDEKQTNCDPNYSGCVPVASDVDCAGGQGDGPAYVKGPVQVIGTDKYKLDGNKDGIACEN